MKTIRIKPAIIIIVLFLSCKAQKNIPGEFYPKLTEQFGNRICGNCEINLSEISKYWIQDSLGKNGFREAIFLDMINHCDSFKNKKWREIEPYLGNYNKKNGNSFYFNSLQWDVSNTSPIKERSSIIIDLDKDSTILEIYKVSVCGG